MRLDLQRHERDLTAVIDELVELGRRDERQLQRILRRHPKDGRGLFSKSDIVRAFRALGGSARWAVSEEVFLGRIRMKPVRTASGVVPVTVLTKPFPCPGRCIFCPSDVRMPKSYLSDEPGAQRAAQHRFDPYWQSLSRLQAYHNNGHRTDKVELIVLGGTWSHYPKGYQLWFIKRCFDALNEFAQARDVGAAASVSPAVDFGKLRERVDGRCPDRSYNDVVASFLRAVSPSDSEQSSWTELEEAQRRNELAAARCVGLVLETRPDELSVDELLRARRLGATKLQIGFQSLSDEVLELNQRGHDVATTRRAVQLARATGFKIHAHWMPNLFGSTPERDIEDFERLFADPGLRPDELKIYPCSLIESAELMRQYENGDWRPYTRDELLAVLTACLPRVPRYCRVTRVVRDIPGTDIVDGNRTTNFREIAEAEIARRGLRLQEIRAREVRHAEVSDSDLRLEEIEYESSIGRERFLEFTTADDRLAAFLRLSLPRRPSPCAEIGDAAVIREVHVYGRVVGLGHRGEGRAQHLGLGQRLIERAARIARDASFARLAVISAVGTREYYRRLGFEDGELYQHRKLGAMGHKT